MDVNVPLAENTSWYLRQNQRRLYDVEKTCPGDVELLRKGQHISHFRNMQKLKGK